MKLRLSDLRGTDTVRAITRALLQVDIGARINFDMTAQLVRIEGRVSLDNATQAIVRSGSRVSTVIDGTVVDTRFVPPRGEVIAL